MKILLLGIGFQGKAALHDLTKNVDVDEIIAADFKINDLKKYVNEKKYSNVTCKFLDANNQESIDNLFLKKPDLVIDLLPYYYRDKIVETAVSHGVSIVNTMYTSPKIKKLANIAKKKNISILPEFGFDPGIDLVLLGKAIKGFKNIEVINSYGAGIPEIEAANNPLKYKVTWSLEGVLRSYFRAGKLIKNGKF